MMSHPEACTALTRMEASLHHTRHNLYELERSLRDRAETETIDSRPKMRRYNRRMSNWTGKDEDTYLHILDRLTDNAAADLERLRRKIERQDMAIEALRRNTGSTPSVPSLRPSKRQHRPDFPAIPSVEGVAFAVTAFQAAIPPASRRGDPLMLQQQSTPNYSADIAAALATHGGHLSIGRGSFTLHNRNGAMLSGYCCEPITAQCIAAGLPVIDSRCVAFDIVVHLTLRGPPVAVGREPDPAPWHGLSYAPLHAAATQYAAAGAEIWNIPEVDTMPTPANRRTAP